MTNSPDGGDAATDRGNTHHPLPPNPVELEQFPTRTADGTWYRAHVDRGGPDHGCWYFSSAGTPPAAFGRFDLPAPRGTCYLANSREVAARERLGNQVVKRNGREYVTHGALTTAAGPVVITDTEPHATHATNLSVKAAGTWVNRSIWAGTGIYNVTQAWAAAFDAARFDGIVYPPRFTLGAKARALALFGPTGTPTPQRQVGTSVALEDVLESIGVEVVTPPMSVPAESLTATAHPPAL